MTTPFTYQAEDVAQAATSFGGRALLAHEPGLGKSLMALLTARQLGALPLVVVCPASVKWTWERECKIHCDWRAEVLEGTHPPRAKLSGQTKVTIVNYDILHAWVDWLRSLNPQLVVLDEVHYAMSAGARRSKAAAALVRGVPHVLGLSGTPMTSRPIELWHPLRLVRPDLYPNRFAYAHKFCKPRRTPWGWDFRGASNLEELHQTLTREVMIRRRKVDVLDQLPPKRRAVIPLDLTGRGEYDQAVSDFAGWLREAHPGRLRQAERAEAIVQLGYLKRLAAKLKMPQALEWIDDHLAGGGDKLILFAVHRSIIAQLHDRYRSESVVVDGGIMGRARQRAFDQFLKTEKTRLFIGNIQAAGVGWSALGVPDAAFVELPWTPGEVDQAEGRTHGIGRGQVGVSSCYHYLLGRHTIEETLARLLQSKQRVLSRVLDGGGREGDFDVFDRLIAQLRREG